MSLVFIVSMALAFGAGVLLVLGLGKLLALRKSQHRLQETLANEPRAAPHADSAEGPDSAPRRWRAVLESMSRLSVPEGGWQNSQLQLKFIRAGFRDKSAGQSYYGVKTLLTLLVPLLGALLMQMVWPAMPYARMALYLVPLMAAAYYLPDMFLRWRTEHRAQDMRDVLPDLIDLLVICTESGLGMDAAINRVSQEIARSSQTLADEFYVAALEIRAGAGRATALKNLALRVDLEDLHGLVSMLVQADRFGTSLVESLRIQSEVMRTKRIQRAEEMAAKVPVKMLIPLVLFIFPALLSVLIGPAVIQIAGIFAKG